MSRRAVNFALIAACWAGCWLAADPKTPESREFGGVSRWVLGDETIELFENINKTLDGRKSITVDMGEIKIEIKDK